MALETLTIGKVRSGIGTLVSVIGTIQGGQATQDASNFEGETLRQQAKSDRQVAAAEARKFEREQSALKAKAFAIRSGSGVVPTSGTPLNVEDDISAEIAALLTKLDSEVRNEH